MHHMSDPSRRSLVTSAAPLPALAVPAAAVAAANVAMPASTLSEQSTQADPIVAAIERWKEAVAIADSSSDEEAFDDAAGAVTEATYAIFKTVPTTLAGMRAKIDFAFSVDHVSELLLNNTADDIPRCFIETLYEGARLMAVQS
jgi:hypothetical protein